MLREQFGDAIDGDVLKPEFIGSLTNHPFMVHHLAQKSLKIYTQSTTDILAIIINKIMSKEFQGDFPLLYPIVNLIDIALTNHNDVSGSIQAQINDAQLIQKQEDSRIEET